MLYILLIQRSDPDATNLNLFLADEKLGLESLVLANQAATTEYRKRKPRVTMKKAVTTVDEKITSFGIVGQLSAAQTTKPVSPPVSPSRDPKPEGPIYSS